MRIELNGTSYILNIRWCDRRDGLVAEIVDESFAFPVERAEISGMADVARTIRHYAGLAPDAALLADIGQEFAEVLQDGALAQMDSGRQSGGAWAAQAS